MHSRFGKWALALTEYSLAFMPLKAMKGQVVSDFIVDHAEVETPQLLVELKPRRLFFDGSTHKESSRVGVLLISPDGIPTKLKYRIEGPSFSNNEAEYEALIAGLEALLELGVTRVEIKGDLELVIKQLMKEYKCIKENLIMYFVIANRLLKKFKYIDIKHVPGIKNQEANDLAHIASGYKISKEKLEELVEVRGKAKATRLSPSDLERNCLGYDNEEEFEVLAIDALTNTDWRVPIIEYLKNPSLNMDRKTKYRALSYVFMGNKLFKKMPEGTLFKCLGENEAYLALSNVHSGTCGAHQVGHIMKWLIFRYGMYWPIMLKDCIEFAKGCQECQIHAGIQHAPASELHAIIKPWPFRGWDLDLIELDEERLRALEVLKRQKEIVARAYNQKVKGKTFTSNDLVWKVILPMDKKNKALGKRSPYWEGPFRVLKAFSNNAYEIEELAEDRRILKVNGKCLKIYKPFMHEVKIAKT
ncbi:uncharacterized protein LOC131659451 [Vicia villosa]|uniref:uncharacterized protein LOC131659451 n=1 Tax=Vicia villosa TaxID=3911 RepID=UPI00273B5763|nr:uncharacterized protein LOC131659451 [Vicia villosa]